MSHREIETDVSVASRDSEGECEMGSESCRGNRISGDTFTVTDVPYAPVCSIFSLTKELDNVVVGVAPGKGRRFPKTHFNVIKNFG